MALSPPRPFCRCSLHRHAAQSVGDAGDDKAGAAAAGGGQGLPFGLGVDPSIMAAGELQQRQRSIQREHSA